MEDGEPVRVGLGQRLIPPERSSVGSLNRQMVKAVSVNRQLRDTVLRLLLEL